MGFFDKLLGKKAESAAKSPETKKSSEQPTQSAPEKELLSGNQLKNAIAKDAATSTAQEELIRRKIALAPGRAGYEDFSKAVGFLKSIKGSSELGLGNDTVDRGGELSSDTNAMFASTEQTAAIADLGTSDAKDKFDKRSSASEGGMFRLSDLQSNPESADKKRAA